MPRIYTDDSDSLSYPTSMKSMGQQGPFMRRPPCHLIIHEIHCRLLQLTRRRDYFNFTEANPVFSKLCRVVNLQDFFKHMAQL